jgi:hypothetical protein
VQLAGRLGDAVAIGAMLAVIETEGEAEVHPIPSASASPPGQPMRRPRPQKKRQRWHRSPWSRQLRPRRPWRRHQKRRPTRCLPRQPSGRGRRLWGRSGAGEGRWPAYPPRRSGCVSALWFGSGLSSSGQRRMGR